MRPASGAELSEAVNAFVAATSFEALPTDVVERGKRSLLDLLGVAVFGSTFDSLEPLRRYVERRRGRAEAGIIANPCRTTAYDAALANGAFVQATEMSETYTRALAHPGNSVLPAALALAEREHRSGRDLLAAYAAGYELLIRLGLAVGPRFVLEQGLHPPATLGALGAAAGATRILGFDGKRTADAMGIAACMVPTALIAASYEQAGVKDTFQAHAAAVGVLAADVAAEGLTGPHRWLEPWAGALPREFDPGPVREIGGAWLISSGGLHFKLLPVMAMGAPTIGAIRNLLAEHALDHREIEGVLVESSGRIVLGDLGFPENLVAARASLPFLAAAALVRQREVREDRYLRRFLRPELLADPDVRRAAGLVELRKDPEFDHNIEKASTMKFEARVTVTMRDGRRLAGYHDTWPETSTMGYDQVADKFRALCEGTLPGERIERVVQTVRELDRLEDVAELVALLGPGPQLG